MQFWHIYNRTYLQCTYNISYHIIYYHIIYYNISRSRSYRNSQCFCFFMDGAFTWVMRVNLQPSVSDLSRNPLVISVYGWLFRANVCSIEYTESKVLKAIFEDIEDHSWIVHSRGRYISAVLMVLIPLVYAVSGFGTTRFHVIFQCFQEIIF